MKLNRTMLLLATGLLIGASPGVSKAAQYCLYRPDGYSDCGFTSFEQCQASASGTGAGCSGGAEPQQSSRSESLPPNAPATRATRRRHLSNSRSRD
jgi:hypothetical protein